MDPNTDTAEKRNCETGDEEETKLEQSREKTILNEPAPFESLEH